MSLQISLELLKEGAGEMDTVLSENPCLIASACVRQLKTAFNPM